MSVRATSPLLGVCGNACLLAIKSCTLSHKDWLEIGGIWSYDPHKTRRSGRGEDSLTMLLLLLLCCCCCNRKIITRVNFDSRATVRAATGTLAVCRPHTSHTVCL